MARRSREDKPEHTLSNVMVVVRESIGGNKRHESLQPIGEATAIWPDTGEQVTVELAAFQFIGDLQVRFVFDGPKYMQGLEPKDLFRFDLSPERALEVALRNIKRVYGEPRSLPYSGTITRIQGGSPDFDSSYFLDRDLWRNLSHAHPEGLIVAVPSRADLFYVPATALTDVDRLRQGIIRAYSASATQRVSSALFLFKSDHWTVFQDPQPEKDQ